MSKMADDLRMVKVFNNWEMLERFGSLGDAVVGYHASARGRMGICDYDRTVVWSPWSHPSLTPTRGMSRSFEKIFPGRRKLSFPTALSWAEEQFGHKYAPSPFGGWLPVHVVKRAKKFLKEVRDDQKRK